MLIGYGATGPDGFAVAAHVLAVTTTLKVLIAHRPGFVAPPLVARKLATLDALSGGGRVAIHHITGGNEVDQKRDGDFLDHDERYDRTGEFMGLLRRTLGSAEPFDHVGRHYRLEGAFSNVRPAPDQPIPLYFGGSSPAALAVTAEHADVYMLWGEPRAEVAARVAALRAAAADHGRTLRFSLSLRPIVAATEDAAWARAERIRTLTASRLTAPRAWAGLTTSVGSQRVQELAARADVQDERLWFGVTSLTGPGGNSTALVGTPRQVAESLERYRELGVDSFLIRGFDPLEDIELWGEELVPLVTGAVGAARP